MSTNFIKFCGVIFFLPCGFSWLSSVMAAATHNAICYTDASIRPDLTGMGTYLGGIVMCRDEQHKFSTVIPQEISWAIARNTNDAEMLAIFEGMLACTRLGITDVAFVHDSAAANTMLRGLSRLRRLESSYLRTAIIRHSEEAGMRVEFRHVGRAQNSLADKLASKRHKPTPTMIDLEFLRGYAAQIPILDFIRNHLGIEVNRILRVNNQPPSGLPKAGLDIVSGVIVATEQATGMLVLAGKRRKEITFRHADWPYLHSGMTLRQAALEWVSETCAQQHFNVAHIAPGYQPMPVVLPELAENYTPIFS
jgi:ribonuclease HI